MFFTTYEVTKEVDIMKYLFKVFYFCLFVVFPLVSMAKPSGTVIFRHPENDYNELWITDLTNTQNAQLIYKHSTPIYEFAAQKNDGPYIAFVADIEKHNLVEPDFGSDIYLFNSDKPKEKAQNLTRTLFDGSWEVDISNKGDIIFTTIRLNPDGNPPSLYLIPNSELQKKEPHIELLLEDSVNSIMWSPNGDQIVFYNVDGIFSLNLATRSVALIQREARYPTFSPDGTKLAFINRPLFNPQDIRIISLANLEEDQIIRLEDREGLRNLKWTLNGKYLVYTTNNNHYAAPIDGGVHEKIFEEYPVDRLRFGWGNRKSYPVEPADHFTTIWGEMKVFSGF